jgi:hypothetical protein
MELSSRLCSTPWKHGNTSNRQCSTYRERFEVFVLTRFSGKKVQIADRKIAAVRG